MTWALDGSVSIGDLVAALSAIGMIGGLCWKLTTWQAEIADAVKRHDGEIQRVAHHVDTCDTDRSDLKVRLAALDERTELMLGGKEAEMHDEQIARVCHEANRAYCATRGDTSQPSWEAAPEWQRFSATAGVLAIREKDVATPRDAHKSWLTQKLAEGWVYGEIKDPVAKTHPCCVPYDDLPVAQKLKDDLFLAIARTLLMESKL